MADITVKKNDGVTDITYTGIAASAGDNSPAIWRANSIGAAVSFRPEMRMVSRANGTKTGRRVEISFVYPETVTGTDGVTRVANKLPITVSSLVPDGMTETVVNEAVSQALNLFASVLVKNSVKAGFAPT